MDILLINSSDKDKSSQAGQSPPLGLAYIASVLLAHGYRVSVIDFNVNGFNPVLLERIITKERPSIAGISVDTRTYPNGLKIAEIVKSINPETLVIMGGPHATVMYSEVAKERVVDFVVRGEGEYTMLELVDCLLRKKGDISEVRGIAFLDNDLLRVTPERPFIKNPDELPLPARDLFPLFLYKSPGQVLLSRGGCPFKCRFCAVNNIWKGARRFREPAKVKEEILSLFRDYDLEEISFVDDTFSLNRNIALNLCELATGIREVFPWFWKCATRVDMIDSELLEKMRQAGCYSITYGIEAGSQEVLDLIGKGITLSQVRHAVDMTIAAGIKTICNFMFPHPYDTEETVQQQRKLMQELANMGATVGLNLTVPFPGTYYYTHRNELGIKIHAHNWDEFDYNHIVISTRHFTLERLESLVAEILHELGQDVGVEFSP